MPQKSVLISHQLCSLTHSLTLFLTFLKSTKMVSISTSKIKRIFQHSFKISIKQKNLMRNCCLKLWENPSINFQSCRLKSYRNFFPFKYLSFTRKVVKKLNHHIKIFILKFIEIQSIASIMHKILIPLRWFNSLLY